MEDDALFPIVNDDYFGNDLGPESNLHDVAGAEEIEGGGEQVGEGRDSELFDSNGRLLIERNVQEVKQFDIMMRNWKDPKGKQMVLDNMYAFLCSISLDNLKKEEQGKFFTLFPRLATVFDHALESSLLDSLYIENMMYHPIFGTSGTPLLLRLLSTLFNFAIALCSCQSMATRFSHLCCGKEESGAYQELLGQEYSCASAV